MKDNYIWQINALWPFKILSDESEKSIKIVCCHAIFFAKNFYLLIIKNPAITILKQQSYCQPTEKSKDVAFNETFPTTGADEKQLLESFQSATLNKYYTLTLPVG